MAPLSSVGSISAQDSTTIAMTALTGTRFFETLRQVLENGTARSRENANIIRDAAVTEATPQNSCATAAMSRIRIAQNLGRAVVQMKMTALASAAVVPSTSVAAKVMATSRMKPKTTDTTTDMIMPMAAVREAWRVSSLMCAEAS